MSHRSVPSVSSDGSVSDDGVGSCKAQQEAHRRSTGQRSHLASQRQRMHPGPRRAPVTTPRCPAPPQGSCGQRDHTLPPSAPSEPRHSPRVTCRSCGPSLASGPAAAAVAVAPQAELAAGWGGVASRRGECGLAYRRRVWGEGPVLSPRVCQWGAGVAVWVGGSARWTRRACPSWRSDQQSPGPSRAQSSQVVCRSLVRGLSVCHVEAPTLQPFPLCPCDDGHRRRHTWSSRFAEWSRRASCSRHSMRPHSIWLARGGESRP
mmetsp:Transcript_12404/g.36052  ORF Transcript_12404/g.36052 Transcript_12404/m.36052 type:complete len:262 (-) Transcript_12404:69-854(-)